MDTIFALASARGKAGIAVVRLSGPLAVLTAATLAGPVPMPKPRQAGLRDLRDGSGALLDSAVVLTFPEGGSFTGEAVAELHLHGSPATVHAVLSVLAAMPGLRMAEAGEFTRRALDNGCLDLAQVEGLADLIDAETEAQRRQALRVLSGAIGRRAEVWRSRLIRAVALLEATIDFADEDVPVDVTPEVVGLIDAVAADLGGEVAGATAAERVRDGFEVAIVGLPNAGKSTLLNALAGREAAITSEHAGTTRDVIEVRMDLGGLAVTFLDTAGLRDTQDVVEGIGITRTLLRARQADLRVFLCSDAGLPEALVPGTDDIVVSGKVDGPGTFRTAGMAGLDGVSGRTGFGVSALLDRITNRLQGRVSAAATITRARHRHAVTAAMAALADARLRLGGRSAQTELAAEDLHRAIRALDSLVGRVDVEQVLDEIFASFCIGK